MCVIIQGLHRGYSEDAVESDDLMMSPSSSPMSKSKRSGTQPARPPRKSSLPRSDNMKMENGTISSVENPFFLYTIITI